MNLSRLKFLSLAVGLLAAGTAQAATITVYAQMAGSPTTGTFAAVGKVADTGTTPIVNCLTSGPAGCVVDVAAASIVLQATSVSNATFVSWTGCASVSGADCTVNMTGAKTVYAVFKPTLYALQVSTYPKKTTAAALPYGGRVTVASAPAIDCRSDLGDTGNCLGGIANGATDVAITAVPDAGSKVTSWTGCTPVAGNSNACTIPVMNVQKSVAATFGAANIPVTAQVSGVGKVTVTANATTGGVVTDGMDCGNGGTDCSAQVMPGKSITLSAVAGSGMSFIGWQGNCASLTSSSCALANVTAAQAVTATFKPSNCSSCHSTPPPTHSFGDGTLSCGQCHFGYTNKTVNIPTHMDGEVAWDYSKVSAPATFGLSFEIVGAGINGSNKPYADVIARNGDGTAMDLIAAINAKEFENGSSSRIPRFAFGEILADGSFVTRLVPAQTTPFVVPTVSETSKASAFGEQPPGRVYRYTFTAAAQAGLDLTKTFRVVVYGARFFKPGGTQPNVQYPASDFLDFSPSGTVVAGKEVVSDEACNACHGALTLHGMRRGVAICLTCHNPNTGLGGSKVDASTLPGGRAPKAASVWDLKNLVHKLHSGQNDAQWGTTFDASHMAMAPSHSGYFESTNTAVHDPGLIRECGLCHDPATAADAGFAFNRPTRAGCGSCHTGVDFATGAGHDSIPAALTVDDSGCVGCHPGVVVQGVHSRFYDPTTNASFSTLPSFPAQGHVFTVNLVGVTVDSNGRPTFTIDAKLDGTAFDMVKAATVTSGSAAIVTTNDPLGGRLPTCAFVVAGPTSDYTFPATGSAQVSCTAVVTPGTASANGPTAVLLTPVLDGGGVAIPGRFSVTQPAQTCSKLTCTATTPVFQGATAGTFKTGAWSVSYEMMYQRQVTVGTDQVRKPFAANPGIYTLVNTGTSAAPAWKGTGGGGDPLIVRGSGTIDDAAYSRRAVVTFDKCNACHVDLGFHSNRGRKGPDYCAVCHNPKLDNATRARVKVSETTTIPGTTQAGFLPESVSMNVFIHRIHMGADLPSVQDPTSASPWVPQPGVIMYGATRSAFTGNAAGTPAVEVGPPDRSDFSNFGMPNPMGRCSQCHIDVGALQTWALPMTDGLAPIERTWKVCNPITPGWTTEQWCNAASSSSSGMPKYTGPGALVVTPPIKAVCTSCHDSAGTNAHVDMNTVGPMTGGAIENCNGCHGLSAPFDSLKMHEAIP